MTGRHETPPFVLPPERLVPDKDLKGQMYTFFSININSSTLDSYFLFTKYSIMMSFYITS